jgi:hypothetical protein
MLVWAFQKKCRRRGRGIVVEKALLKKMKYKRRAKKTILVK